MLYKKEKILIELGGVNMTKKKNGILIKVLYFISTLIIILLMSPSSNAFAALGGGSCSPVSVVIPDSYGASWWVDGANTVTSTSNYQYSSPSVWLVSGDVHDRLLSAGDFNTIQYYSYTRHWTETDVEYTRVTTYKVLMDDDCEPYAVPAGSYDKVTDSNTTTWTTKVNTSRKASISVSTISNGRYTTGVSTSRATVNYPQGGSATATGTSYWVRDVNISVEASNIWIEEDSASCVQTYGDGHTKGCTPTKTIVSNPISHKRVKYYYQNPSSLKSDTKYQNVYKLADVNIVQNGARYVDAFRGAPGPDFSCTKTYHNNVTRDCKNQVSINLNVSGWTTGLGTRVVRYDANISEGNTHSDTERQSFHYVTRVQFIGTKNAYVSTTATYYEDVNLALKEENYTVKCIKTFGDGVTKRDCIPESEVKLVNSKSQSSGGTHPVTGSFTHNANQNGWSLGGAFRNNYYQYNENNKTTNWTVRMLYVIKVVLANGTPENQFVAVNETHNKKVYLGNPTKASSPHQTDPYTPPTCEKTFATATTGAVEVRDCFSQMEWNHNWNNWTLGGSERILRFKYKENRKQDDWKIHFTYVRNVDIVVTKPLVYQDEDYGSYSCTKTYYHTYIGGGITKDCLDRMYIDSDSGQNKSLGGQRRINYDYKNNTSSDLTLQTRPYGHRTIIGSVNATTGKTGYRDSYTCDVHWQNNVLKDVTMLDKVWTSNVSSTGEIVNYIGETWNGYTDRKGQTHGPIARNEFYIVDPKTKDYDINCTYPDMPIFDNGLRPGWTFVTDVYAPVTSKVPFRVVGINRIEIWDATNQAHEVDIDASGNRVNGSLANLLASNYTGSTSVSHAGNKVMNNRTYQTGHWANFQAVVHWDETFGPSTVVSTASAQEATWSYMSSDNPGQKVPLGGTASDATYRIDTKGYKVGGVNTGFPRNANDHRLPNERWNDIRFDYFSEENVRKPGGQVNKVVSKTFETASLWAHSPEELYIEGPISTTFDVENEYKSHLLWSDGAPTPNQGASKNLGDNTNPWNQKTPVDVTDSQWSGWYSAEQGALTPSPTVRITFDEYESNNNYRTLRAWWGDEYEGSGTYVGNGGTYPNGFTAWDFFFQEIDILVGEEDASGNPIIIDPTTTNNCSMKIPTFGCNIDALKDDGTGNKNYRLPTHVYTDMPRQVEMDLLFNVTGVSKGSGQ